MTIETKLILDYSLFFNDQPPEYRLSFLKGISRKNLLVELVGTNYKLKPKGHINIDISLKTQIDLLKQFTCTYDVYVKYFRVFSKYTKSKSDYPLIFTRQTFLFAIEEILGAKEICDIENYQGLLPNDWESILKYLLSVNHTITQIRNDSKNTFESLNSKLIPLNELSIETDPILTSYRGFKLIEYFINKSPYSEELKLYLKDQYGLEPFEFVYHIMSMCFGNQSENSSHNFFYQVPNSNTNNFDKLSNHYQGNEAIKLLSIRKNPFIKIDVNRYILTDNIFLIEKLYSQLINDFWFDRIKVHYQKEGPALYRSHFGLFFEDYSAALFKRSIGKHRNSTLLLFDQLKIRNGKNQIEISDIYYRYKNKIILGQVKSRNIYDDRKYSGDIETLYKNDRNLFFADFGVNQLCNSLITMDRHIKEIDSGFPKGKSYKVYPCIIVNDRALQTFLMANTFNQRFQELIILQKVNRVKVMPLSLIHISDLERIEKQISVNPKLIWELFRYNFRIKQLIPPFFRTVNAYVKRLSHSKQVLKLLRELVKKYSISLS